MNGYAVYESALPELLVEQCAAEINDNPQCIFEWTSPLAQEFRLCIYNITRREGFRLDGTAELHVFNRGIGREWQTAWHDDDPATYGLPKGPNRIFVCAYLTPTTHGRGALRVIPNSHKGGYGALRSQMRAFKTWVDSYPEGKNCGWTQFPDLYDAHPDQETITVPAGSLIVCDEKIIHGTEPNVGPNRRTMALYWLTERE